MCRTEIFDTSARHELLTQKESQFVTLFVLLISADLRVLDPHWNLGVTRKFKMRLENTQVFKSPLWCSDAKSQ
jgi:hypothetical protein